MKEVTRKPNSKFILFLFCKKIYHEKMQSSRGATSAPERSRIENGKEVYEPGKRYKSRANNYAESNHDSE